MINRKPLGLYIHIPFCERKCNYCDFLSAPANDNTKKEYVEALIKEIKSYKDIAKDYIVQTVFIGGGTPSSIHEDFISDILNAIREYFLLISENEIEITLEANPGTLTKDKLISYQKSGINRLSIGLQSADDNELKLLGRIHTFADFVSNYTLARELGFTNISIDLISALPSQTEEDFIRTLNQVIELNPEHISAYSLIIEEGTTFYQIYAEESNASSQLPDEETERRIYQSTNEILLKHGYLRYEISNYSKPGYESKHNSSYWQRVEYLGLGLGASSFIQNNRYHNETDLKEYITLSYDYHNIIREKERLSIKDQMEEFMFLGLRMCKGISKSDFKSVFGIDITDVYGEVLLKLIHERLIVDNKERIYLTQRGLDISNYVFSEFLLER